jgi:hypothetical protein
MMVFALLLMFTGLCVFTLKESFTARAEREKRESLDQFRNFQAYAIRKYHPVFKNVKVLSEMSVQDIRENFDVTSTYNQIGRW